jgi:hypothetical protein
LAPEPFTAAVMVLLAFIAATFLVRALMRRNRRLYLIWVLIVGFFDVSYYMAFLDRQHQKMEQGVDPELVRRQGQTDKAQTALDVLTEQQGAAQNRKTLDNLDAQIRSAQQTLKDAQSRETDYASGGLMALAVDPRTLAMAIPNAAAGWLWSDAWQIADLILLGVIVALFVALQWTLAEAVGIALKRSRAETRKTSEPVKRKKRRKPRAKVVESVPDAQA